MRKWLWVVLLIPVFFTGCPSPYARQVRQARGIHAYGGYHGCYKYPEHHVYPKMHRRNPKWRY